MIVDTSHHDAASALPRIAGFRLLREIGQGGMSTVFLAEQESLGRKVAVKIMLPEALDYAHVRGVVHRDVKAENVLFDDAERPLLADFGIALRKGVNPRLTMTGLAVGSTAYMPPEQARGEEVDSRADLYSIGVLAWEMLTGSLPFLSLIHI